MYAVEMIVVMPNGEPTNGKSDKHKKRKQQMKTSEQMADEYADSEGSGNETYEHGLRQGFLAGYQAALDQLADAGKVMNSPEKLDGWISVKDRLPEDK